MSDSTQPIKGSGQQICTDDNLNGDSHIVKVSVRAWLAMCIVVTICIMSALKIEVLEPLYTLGSLTVGFYFGQKSTSTK